MGIAAVASKLGAAGARAPPCGEENDGAEGIGGRAETPGGMFERTDGGMSGAETIDGRIPPCAASRTSVASSGMLLIGRHSSRPSCQHSESSVTAPVAALRRSSEMRTGPTGTPLIATYHSSLTESASGPVPSCCASGTDASGASERFRWNAPARAPAGADGAFGLVWDRLVASGRAGTGGRGGGAARGERPPLVGTESPGLAGGASDVDSVTAARTSIWCPHLRHFMRTVLPATFSSAIWYFALQLSQRNFTRAPFVERLTPFGSYGRLSDKT